MKNLFDNILTTEQANSLLSKQDLTKASGRQMESEIRAAAVVQLTLAFSPSQNFTEELSKDIRTSLKDTKILMDLSIDPTIIGGAQISYKGKYSDQSVKSRLSLSS